MKKIILTIVLIVVLIVGWYLASPLFIDKTVDEALPFADVNEETYVEMSEVMEELGMEPHSMEEIQRMTEEEAHDLGMEMLRASEDMEDISVEEQMPTKPILLSQGSFVDADAFHKGSGSALVYTLPDGSSLLRFEDFSVTNGPDLRVLLARDGEASDSVELGRLKGNKGAQNYEIDSGIDLDVYNTVMIYCKPFRVNFATAELVEL